jgi:hypothetical protein
MTSHSMKSTAKDTLRLLTSVLRVLTKPTSMTMAILFLAAFWLVANHSFIGASSELVFSYSLMLSLMLIWAFYRKVPLERLDWRTKDIISGKYEKKPGSIHWAFIIAFIAFLLTVAFGLVRYNMEKTDLPSSLALEMAWQQLIIISLSEAVIFQGVFPLIIEWELETSEGRKKKEAETNGATYQAPNPLAVLITVIIVSQFGLFGLSHYTSYGADWMEIGFVGIPGTLWYLGGKYFGIQTAWFSHFGWNLVALGLIGVPAATALVMKLIGA